MLKYSSMYAVIETGGKQIKAEAGKSIETEKLPGKEGDKVSFDVLMLVSGNDTQVGTPKVPNALVKGHITQQGRKEKVIVYKMRPKKHYERKLGHRQCFSKVFIDAIEINGKVIVEANGLKDSKTKNQKK